MEIEKKFKNKSFHSDKFNKTIEENNEEKPENLNSNISFYAEKLNINQKSSFFKHELLPNSQKLDTPVLNKNINNNIYI